MERYYYVCCQDGDHKGSEQVRKTNKKRPHQKPSRKLGATGISWMYVTKFNSGKFEVKYISAHSNHTPDQSEAGFYPCCLVLKKKLL